MTDDQTVLVGALAQNIAPRLFNLFGTPPEEMGFPIYDTKEEVNEHLARQFSPVEYWTEKATEIAASLVRIMEAGGINLASFDYDKAVDVARQERPDLAQTGEPTG